jgi:hypothetical protein
MESRVDHPEKNSNIEYTIHRTKTNKNKQKTTGKTKKMIKTDTCPSTKSN